MAVKETMFNFRMPAEYAPHERTLMSWPVRETMCYPDNYQEFCGELAHAALEISRFEPVTMLVNKDSRSDAEKALENRAEIVEIPHNDCWLRDNGPTILLSESGDRVGVNWKFNAWGQKYPEFELDDQVAPKLLKHLGIPELTIAAVMEGGSFHTDGRGTVLTTEECILNKNRNPEKTREEIGELLRKTLGAEKIIYLPTGLYGDETDGHVDNVACFAAPGTILLQVCNDSKDPNYERSREHVRVLESEADASGRKLNIVKIPQPAITEYRKKRLTLSYLNFYFVNRGLILPLFGQETDLEVIKIFRRIFPNRTIATVDGLKLVKEGGNIHCLTQQVPKERLGRSEELRKLP